MTRTLSVYTVARVTEDWSTAPVPDWRDDRACTDADAELFYPTEHATSTDPAKRAAAWAPARAICAACLVITACLEDALTWEPGGIYYRHGMRGGLDPRERANLVRSRQRKAKREAAPTVEGSRLDEIARLLAAGVAPETVARRMSSTVGAIARYAYRANAPEIGNVFEKAARAVNPDAYHLRDLRANDAKKRKRASA